MSPLFETKYRRRLRQFSLGGLMLLMTVSSLVIAWCAREHRRIERERLAKQAVEKLQQQMTAVSRDHWIDAPLQLETSPLPWWLQFSSEKHRYTVTGISFDLRSYDDGLEEASPIKDEDLLFLKSFPELRRLALPRSKITDAGLRTISSLRKLSTLDLSGTTITDDGLRSLARLKSLQELTLDFTKIRGDCLEDFEKCPELRALTLRLTPLDAQSASHLNRLRSLERLVVDSSTLDRLHLNDLHRLTELVLTLQAPTSHLRLTKLPAAKSVHLQFSTVPQRLEISNLPNLDSLVIITGEKLPRHDETTGPIILREFPKLRQLRVVGDELPRSLDPTLGQFTALEELSLTSQVPGFDDAAAAALRPLTRLKRLEIQKSLITDVGMATLAALPALKELTIHARHVTPTGIASLSSSRQLKTLQVSGAQATFDPGSTLATLKSLETLSLGDCRFPSLTFVGNPQAEHQPFPHLKRLGVSGEGIQAIRVVSLNGLNDLSLSVPSARALEIDDLPALARLDVSLAPMQVVDQFLLRDLPQLRWLSIQCGPTGARVPGHIFDHLLEFKSLENGIVWGLEMPPEARKKLEDLRQATGLNLN